MIQPKNTFLLMWRDIWSATTRLGIITLSKQGYAKRVLTIKRRLCYYHIAYTHIHIHSHNGKCLRMKSFNSSSKLKLWRSALNIHPCLNCLDSQHHTNTHFNIKSMLVILLSSSLVSSRSFLIINQLTNRKRKFYGFIAHWCFRRLKLLVDRPQLFSWRQV